MVRWKAPIDRVDVNCGCYQAQPGPSMQRVAMVPSSQPTAVAALPARAWRWHAGCALVDRGGPCASSRPRSSSSASSCSRGAGAREGGAALRTLGTPIPDAPGSDEPLADQARRFCEDLERNGRCQEWQVRQAEQALRIYFVNFLQRTDWHRRPASTVVGEQGRTNPLAALDELRRRLRTRHYAYRTECSYADWVRRFFAYLAERQGVLHPRVASEAVRDFLTHLAVERRVSSSTQNQAFCAILFPLPGGARGRDRGPVEHGPSQTWNPSARRPEHTGDGGLDSGCPGGLARATRRDTSACLDPPIGRPGAARYDGLYLT